MRRMNPVSYTILITFKNITFMFLKHGFFFTLLELRLDNKREVREQKKNLSLSELSEQKSYVRKVAGVTHYNKVFLR
jgi:hypothetical protein